MVRMWSSMARTARGVKPLLTRRRSLTWLGGCRESERTRREAPRRVVGPRALVVEEGDGLFGAEADGALDVWEEVGGDVLEEYV